jgi:branched-chain amino acid transport system permease protein
MIIKRLIENKKWIQNYKFQIGLSLIIFLGILLPQILKNQYQIHLVFLVGIYSVLAVSLNIAVGYCGLANLAHGTFFGLGAYAAALLALNLGVPFYITLILSGLFASLFGILLGIPALRLEGFYLALATIGFGQIIRLIQLNWVKVTKGPMGLPGIPGAEIFNYQFSKVAFCYYVLFLLVISIIISWRIQNSRIGRALFAIKNDPLAANSLGVNIVYYKVLALALSSFLAGSAGSIYAHYVTFVSPDTFTQADSITIMCMVILGGAGTIFGPVIGALLLVLIPEIFRFVDLYRMIFVGAVMIIGVLFVDGTPGEYLKFKLNYFFKTKFGNTDKGGKAVDFTE